MRSSLNNLPRQPYLRLLVVWLSGLLLLLQSGHMTLVSHAVCAAHGELLHSQAHAGDEHAAGQPSTAAHAAGDEHHHEQGQRDDDSVGAKSYGPYASAPGHQERHDHCDAVATEDGHEIARVSLPDVTIEWLRLAHGQGSQATVTRSRLYLLAPKTSPPRS